MLETPVSEPSKPIQVIQEKNDDGATFRKKEINEENKSTWSYDISSLMNYKKVREMLPTKVSDMMPFTTPSKEPIRAPNSEISKLVDKEAIKTKRGIEVDNNLPTGSNEISSLNDIAKVS